MPTPTSTLDTIRDKRKPAVNRLVKLAAIIDEIHDTNAHHDRLMARRLAAWKALRALDPPVSWADIARVSGVKDVTVIQAVSGRGPASPR